MSIPAINNVVQSFFLKTNHFCFITHFVNLKREILLARKVERHFVECKRRDADGRYQKRYEKRNDEKFGFLNKIKQLVAV